MLVGHPQNGSGKNQRFMDAKDEPLSLMLPIKGYEKMPLVSLEEAVRPLVRIIPDVEHMVYITKERCAKSPSDKLSLDQVAAIMLYTLEWTPKEGSFYVSLNQTLRKEDRKALKPWFLYLKLFFRALGLLPPTPRTVFRGIRGDLRKQYKPGATVYWWGFSSCTSKLDVLNDASFLGTSGTRTMFTIECHSGRDIHEHSYFNDENEVLLPAAREFKVESVVHHDGDLSMVQLRETQPKYPLLESFPTSPPKGIEYPLVSKLVPKKHPVPEQPYYIEEEYQHPQMMHAPSAITAYNENKVCSCSSCLLYICRFMFCCPCSTVYVCCCKE